MSEKNKELHDLKLKAIAIKRLKQLEKNECFDAFDLDSRANEKQLEILKGINKYKYRYVVAGNRAGKSQTAAREITWLLNRSHPHFKTPKEWEGQHLTCLIAVQNLTLGETEIWNKKIQPFLDNPGDYSKSRQGNTLKSVKNKKTGDEIVFLSHSDGSEKNRKMMQGFTAQYVWVDELPASSKILEELEARIATTNGRLIATFTPKFVAEDIKKKVDGADGVYAKKYRLSMLDNPLIDRDEQLSRLAHESEAVRNTVLYGDWSVGEQNVYYFNYKNMVVDKLPDNYGPHWRHILSVDPAITSKTGYALLAENPIGGTWYLIDDRYFEGNDTLDTDWLVNNIEKRIEGYNIYQRISDNMAWFFASANKFGISYISPNKKDKDRLIKVLQNSLSSGKLKIFAGCKNAIEEINNCRFKEDSDKIINSSRYHTLDSLQYFADNIPHFKGPDKVYGYYETIKKLSDEQKTKASPNVNKSQAYKKIMERQSTRKGRIW